MIWSLLLTNVTFALKPAPSDVEDISSPVFTVYGTEDGLSDEVWSTVGIDRDGFVWAGSASKLARFDSQRWTLWPFPEAKSLVRDMEPDAKGNLWAIFEGEGLARYDGKRWQLVGSGLDVQLHRLSLVRSPQKLGADPAQTQQLWVTTEGKGLSVLGSDGRWQHDPAKGVPAGETVNAIERTQRLFGAPREWLSTNTGLWFRAVPAQQAAPTPWQRYLAAPESQQIAGTDLLVTIENGVETLWMTSYGGGVLRIREDGVKVWRAATGELPSEAIYTAVATYDRNGVALVWLSSRGGLIKISGDTATTYDRRNGLPSDAVRGVKVQRVGEVDVLWIATEQGVARTALTYSRWQSVSLHGARENGIFGLLVETDAGATRVWAGSSSQGLAVLANGRWRQLLEADGYDLRRVRTLAGLTGPDGLGGSYWRLVSLQDGPLLRIGDDGTFRAVATPWPMPPGQTVTGMYAQTDRAAGMWFATARSGVFRLRQGSWQAIPLRGSELSDPDSWIVYRFVETPRADGSMQLWALGNTGLARLDGEYFQSVSKQIDLNDALRGGARIQLGEATRLWLGSNRRGVIQLDVSDPQHPTVVNDGLPDLADPTIYSVLQDSAKRIYLCTNNGVQLLTPKANGGFDSEIFRRRDGLIHDECNTNGQLIDAQDRYWVGTLGGLGRFDPHSAQNVVQRKGGTIADPSSTAAPLRLSAVDIDGRALPWPLPETLEIPAGASDVQLRFSLLSGVREGESRYRSQLLAKHLSAPDAGISPWSSDATRHLGNLAPGRYQLWVEARDYAGISSAPLSISINVNAKWWQKPAVQIVSALIVVGLIGIGVWFYNRQLRLRQNVLRQLIQEKTVELSESNRLLLALSYTDPLTNIANRRRLTEAMQVALSRAQQRQLPMAVILVDIDFFKPYNDKHGHLAGDVALRAVAQALNSAVREQDLVARYGGEEFACLLLDTSAELALQVAERMRALVAELPARALGNDQDTITLSAGVWCQIPAPDDTPERLISAADAALYQAKAQGRNRVVLATKPYERG